MTVGRYCRSAVSSTHRFMAQNTTDNIPPKPAEPAKVPSAQRGALTCAKLAPIGTLLSWAVLLLPFNWSGYVGLALSLASILLASIGLRAPKRFWHEISLTSLIAAAILCVVIVVFIALLLVVI